MNVYHNPPSQGCDENLYNGCGCLTPPLCPAEQHFRGWKVTWDTSTGTETHCFGDCTQYKTSDKTLTFNDEIMYFTMAIDKNDIEGFAFKEWSQT